MTAVLCGPAKAYDASVIQFACKCGRTLTFPVKMGGKFARCPDCRNVVAIPEARLREGDGDTPAPDRSALELEDRNEGAPVRPSAPPKVGTTRKERKAIEAVTVACPSCGARYAPEVIFCTTCAVVIATGQPVAGLVPGGASAPHTPYKDPMRWVKWIGILVAILVLAFVAMRALK